MRIAAVDVYPVEVGADSPSFRWREGLPGSEPDHVGAYLRVRTDEGVDGVGWCERGSILADLVDRRVRAELVGADPLRREWLWKRMWELDRIEEFPIYLQGSIDVALWDIAAKVAGQPVYKLLGGFRESITAYASTTTFADVDEYLDVADQCLAAGYRAIKLHAWGDAERDSELILKLREHVGHRVPLMYDGSGAFDVPGATVVARACVEAGYLWCEEPMREFNVTAYRWLAERTQVPLLVAETSDGAHWSAADWVTSGSAAYVRTGVDFKAGLTGAVRIAHLAEAFGLRAEVHGGGIANAHLALSLPNTSFYESLVTSNPVRRETLVSADGLVRVPDTAGFGAAVGPVPLPW